MTVLLPTGFVQASIRYTSPTFASGGAANTFGWGAPGAPVMTSLSFADEVAEAVETHLRALIDSSITLASVYVQSATDSAEVGIGLNGTRSGEGPPPNVAVLQTLRTATKGRRGRGRLYWPGLLNGNEIQENGNILAAAHTRVQNGLVAFWGALQGLDVGTQVILQRDEPDQKSPPLNPPPEVNGRITQTRVATQRRRLRR